MNKDGVMAKCPILYKKTSAGKVQTWMLEINETGDGYRTVSGQLDGKKVTSGWTICESKNVGRSNEVDPKRQCVIEVNAEYKKKLAQGGYVENIEQIENETYFKVMLAKSYDDYPIEDFTSVYSQPKLDGMRCVSSPTGQWSRQGKPIPTVPFISALREKAAQYTGMKNLILDGELYNHDLRHDFNEIMSLCKKKKPTNGDIAEAQSKIQYWVYDIPCNLPFGERTQLLKKICDNVGGLVYVPTHQVKSASQIDTMYEQYLEHEFEGQILRVGTKGYENKRTNALLKRKEFIDNEFLIVDIIEGTGNRMGIAGAMMFETAEGKPFRANIMGQRAQLAEYLRNRDEYIGEPATVCYFKPTPDGIPRFPRVKAVYKGGRDV